MRGRCVIARHVLREPQTHIANLSQLGRSGNVIYNQNYPYASSCVPFTGKGAAPCKLS